MKELEFISDQKTFWNLIFTVIRNVLVQKRSLTQWINLQNIFKHKFYSNQGGMIYEGEELQTSI